MAVRGSRADKARQEALEYQSRQKQVNEDIRLGKYKPVYLIYGDESYLRLFCRDELRKALTSLAGEMNLMTVKGDEISPGEIVSFAETIPFFSEKRAILVEDSGFFKNGCETLERYLKNPSGTAVIVFTETAVDKSRAMYKRVSERGRIVYCCPQFPDTLGNWAASRLKQAGKVIRTSTMNRFLERTGNDMSRIASELEKLIAYTGDRNEVTAKDIRAVCTAHIEGVVYELTDAIAEKNREKAIRCYMTMLAMKEKPAKILYHLTRQFELLLLVSEMRQMTVGMETMMRVTGKKDSIVSKYIRLSRRFSESELRRLLEMCASNDQAVKNGLLDHTIAIEMVVAQATAQSA